MKLRDKDEWTDWDYLLAEALQVIEDWTDQHGLLTYEARAHEQRVIVEAHKKIDPFEAAKERKTKGTKNKPYNPQPGEFFVPKLLLADPDDEWPTREEYIRREIELEELNRD